MKRARDTAKGMAAVTADMIVLSVALSNVVRDVSGDSTTLPRLATFRQEALKTALKFTSNPTAGLVNAPWRLVRACMREALGRDAGGRAAAKQDKRAKERAFHRQWSDVREVGVKMSRLGSVKRSTRQRLADVLAGRE